MQREAVPVAGNAEVTLDGDLEWAMPQQANERRCSLLLG